MIGTITYSHPRQGVIRIDFRADSVTETARDRLPFRLDGELLRARYVITEGYDGGVSFQLLDELTGLDAMFGQLQNKASSEGAFELSIPLGSDSQMPLRLIGNHTLLVTSDGTGQIAGWIDLEIA